ncbi:MAG: GNAT family N-acetyltransferase [Spirochaetes bacterium]|nr:GNAT family N-acetyltransferase [Spirochaetota bacterium]
MYLTNKVIYLKKLTMRYARDFKKLFNDPFITRYLTIPYPLEQAWIRDYITSCMEKHDAGEKYAWGIFKADINKFVGVCVLKDIDQKNRVAKLGYSVGKRFWNNGYTLMAVRLILKYAFTNLDLNRIEVRIDMEDEKSVKLLEEVSGKKEGIMRSALLYENSYRDVYLYSVLKNEYLIDLKERISRHDMLSIL